MIKIIVVHNTLPNVRGWTTILINNIIPILQKKMEVEIVWVIHSNIDISEYKCDKNERIIKMNDYTNAFEILEKEKPDLIYIIAGISTPDYAFSIAAKSLKIFRIGSEIGNLFFTKKSKISTLSQIKNDRKDAIPQLKNFFANNKFLINTQKKAGWNDIKIFRDLCSIFFMYFPIKVYGSRPEDLSKFAKFELDLHFIESDLTLKTITDIGFDKSKIMITGNPSYDEIFQLLKTPKKNNIQKNKKNILILTTIIFGELRKKALSQRKLFIQKVTKAIPKDEFDVVIKIHPTHEDLDDYTNILGSLNSSVSVIQNANLAELILNADIIITPVTGTSAITAFVARKPIIIWNVFNVKNDVLVDKELALECKNQKMILKQIRKAETWLPKEEKIEQFIKEFLHSSDGKASERIADGILNFLKVHNLHFF